MKKGALRDEIWRLQSEVDRLGRELTQTRHRAAEVVARLVEERDEALETKYKWQRDEAAAAVADNYRGGTAVSTEDVVADLDRRWEER